MSDKMYIMIREQSEYMINLEALLGPFQKKVSFLIKLRAEDGRKDWSLWISRP